MPKITRLISFSIACLAILCLTVPVSAAEYKVGVKTGDWVIYGNYEVVDTGDEGSIPAWSKLEVSAVADQKVLFFANGFYRNGTEFYYHMERSITSNTTLIIGANLTEGDLVTPAEEARINRTETRKYLGVDRTVNIVEFTRSIEGVEFSALFVYDQATGLLLEYRIEETLEAEVASDYKYAYNIVDSNIFGVKPSPTVEPPVDSNQYLIWIGGAAAATAVIVLIGILVFKKKQNTNKRKRK